MSNCLGLRCPKCGNTDRAYVWVRTIETGTDADASDDGEHWWGDNAETLCAKCGHRAAISAFKTSP